MIQTVVSPLLVGRAEQLDHLEDGLLAANRGESRFVVLAGEAGIGKTRLAGELEQRAHKLGTTVLWGSCSEAELALPYLPILEALGNYLADQDVALGLVRHDLPGLRVDQPPLLLFLLAGYEGAGTSAGKLERLRKAVEHKKKRFSTLRVHTHAFGDFKSESCTLPSITNLPLFEEWAERELQQTS